MRRDHSSELRATCKIRLGEALAESGQYRGAATAFERALAWSPGNEAVKEKLDAARLAVYDSVYDVMESGLHIFEFPNSSIEHGNGFQCFKKSQVIYPFRKLDLELKIYF
jgi:hypothetical protein